MASGSAGEAERPRRKPNKTNSSQTREFRKSLLNCRQNFTIMATQIAVPSDLEIAQAAKLAQVLASSLIGSTRHGVMRHLAVVFPAFGLRL